MQKWRKKERLNSTPPTPLMKLGNLVKMQKFEKFWQRRWNFGHFSQTWFSQNHAGTDFFFKNDARKLKFEPDVPLNSILKTCGTDFWIIDFFWKHWRFCPKFLTFLPFCPKFRTYFQTRSKIKKSVPQIFRYYIEVLLVQISAS